MAKISPVAAKYIIHSRISIAGIVDRPDVIGAIFGQTEGLLGNELELRELQRSGRIGRIEVNTNTSSGKTSGEIIIPSSLDKTETAIIAASMEVIQRIGPCTAKLEVTNLEDIRISKRQFVVERAKELLKTLMENTLPDSQELTDEVAKSVRVMEAVEYGRERLAAGPAIDESEEIVIVEGRADVMNLLRQGFKNVIAMNGTSCPETIKELTKKKTTTLFVDGDRGGNLIIRELLSVAEIDFVCRAPDGKEVEEITKKEIHKALRSRVTAEQAKLELGVDETGAMKEQPERLRQSLRVTAPSRSLPNRPQRYARPPLEGSRPPLSRQDGPSLTPEEKSVFKSVMDDLFGTHGACIFDQNLNILGKVPLSELSSTVQSLNGGVYAIALDGTVDPDLVRLAEKVGVTHVLGTGSTVKEMSKVRVLTDESL
ncbi:MAG TPA: DNA primase DnaG [Candidatus Nanoarchaeia archaeon]|nr:DNA primase DnaG [Candidatus Nanoarchaeia archaeon]